MSSAVELAQHHDDSEGKDQFVENEAFEDNIAVSTNNHNDDNNDMCNRTDVSESPESNHAIASIDSKRASPEIRVVDSDGVAVVSSKRRCAACRIACLEHCSTERNPLQADASLPRRIRFAFLCPPHGNVARTLTLLFVLAYVWGTLWSVLGDDALPGGNYFALTALLVLCVIAGELVEKVHLPPLLGTYWFEY